MHMDRSLVCFYVFFQKVCEFLNPDSHGHVCRWIVREALLPAAAVFNSRCSILPSCGVQINSRLFCFHSETSICLEFYLSLIIISQDFQDKGAPFPLMIHLKSSNFIPLIVNTKLSSDRNRTRRLKLI